MSTIGLDFTLNYNINQLVISKKYYKMLHAPYGTESFSRTEEIFWKEGILENCRLAAGPARCGLSLRFFFLFECLALIREWSEHHALYNLVNLHFFVNKRSYQSMMSKSLPIIVVVYASAMSFHYRHCGITDKSFPLFR